MKKSIIITLHLGFWLCYSLIIILFFGALPHGEDDVPFKLIANLIVGIFYLPSLITFYLFYFVFFQNFLLKKKILKFCLYGISTSLIAAVIGILTMNLFVPNSAAIQSIIIVTPIALISGIVALVIRGFVAWFEGIKLKQELTVKTHKMEIALIKAQLDPHFLFNTLNNIDVLIQKRPEEASIYLNKLSDIMRFMLFETKTDNIELIKELEYLEKYIELQKIRSTNPNFVNFLIKGEHHNKKISPMVFIPFVENAFKHVANKQEKNAIDIQINIGENNIQFECTNNSNKKINPINQYNGLGNDLIQKRLNLLYPNRYNLTIDNQSDFYKVTLTLDYDQN